MIIVMTSKTHCTGFIYQQDTNTNMMPLKHCDIPFLQMAGNILRYNVCNELADEISALKWLAL